jgi:hypothetical protein
MKHQSKMNQEEPSSSKSHSAKSPTKESSAGKITLGEKLDGLHQSAAFHWRHANVFEVLFSKHIEVLEVALPRSKTREGHAILLL